MLCAVLRVVNTTTMGWGRRGVRGTQDRVRRDRQGNGVNVSTVDTENINQRRLIKLNNINKVDLEEEFKKELATSDTIYNDIEGVSNASDKRKLSDNIIQSVKGEKTYKMQIKELKREFSSQVVTVENQLEMVTNAVTMLHHLPYKQQLEMKQIKNKDVVARLFGQKKIRNQIVCKPAATVPSPITQQYRTKDEFSVFTNIQGELTVGF